MIALTSAIPMQTLIKSVTKDPKSHSVYIHAQCDNTEARVSIHKDKSLTILCINASHRARRCSVGRYFADKAAAFAHYRSPQMRAIIDTAHVFDLTLLPTSQDVPAVAK